MYNYVYMYIYYIVELLCRLWLGCGWHDEEGWEKEKRKKRKKRRGRSKYILFIFDCTVCEIFGDGWMINR